MSMTQRELDKLLTFGWRYSAIRQPWDELSEPFKAALRRLGYPEPTVRIDSGEPTHGRTFTCPPPGKLLYEVEPPRLRVFQADQVARWWRPTAASARALVWGDLGWTHLPQEQPWLTAYFTRARVGYWVILERRQWGTR